MRLSPFLLPSPPLPPLRLDLPVRLFLVIHDLDGCSLSSYDALVCLRALVSTDRIRIVATVDHVDAGLLFDSYLRYLVVLVLEAIGCCLTYLQYYQDW